MTGWDPNGNASGLPPFIPEHEPIPEVKPVTPQSVWPYPTVIFDEDTALVQTD